MFECFDKRTRDGLSGVNVGACEAKCFKTKSGDCTRTQQSLKTKLRREGKSTPFSVEIARIPQVKPSPFCM